MYYPNLKTSDAELRAIRHISDASKREIMPVFELTRSRITKNLPEGSLIKRLEQTLDAYGDFSFILDLSTQSELMNAETLSLFDESNGYVNWITFLDDHAGMNVIPSLLFDDDGSKQNFQSQARELYARYGKVCLRISATDELALQLLNWTTEVVPDSDIIICGMIYYIEHNRLEWYKALCADFMRDVVGNRRPSAIIFPGSSFPRFITDLPNCEDASGTFPSQEILLDEWLRATFPAQNIEKSDFASVHPIRYPASGGNWIPRIDIFNGSGFNYVRSRRNDGGYEEAASAIAESQLNNLPDCWGKRQIQLARNGIVTGGSPSYWISVRINCWITARSRG